MIKANTSKNRILTILLASVLMDFMGIGIIIPLLPFLAKSLGASALEIGLLFGTFFFISIFTPSLWGNLSDRIGRRPALLFNVAGTTLSFLWLSFSNALWMLFLARILAGATSASIVIAQSYVTELTTIENRTKTLGFLEATAGIGFVIGPVIGGLLMGSDPNNPNFRLPGLAAAAAGVLTFSFGFITLPRSDKKIVRSVSQSHRSFRQFISNFKQPFQRSLVGVLLAVVFFVAFASMGTQSIFALWCEQQFGWGPQQFGYFIIFYCLLVALFQIGLVGPLTHWLGEVKLLFWSLMATAVGLLLIPFATTVPQLIGTIPLIIFSTATSNPALVSLLSRLAGAKQQGKTLGLMQSAAGLGCAVGAVGAGLIYDTLGVNWPFWVASGLMVIATTIAWLKITQSRLSAVMRRRRQQKSMHLFELLDQDNNGILELQDFQRAAQDLAKLRGWRPETAEYEVLQTSFIGFGTMLQKLADRDNNQQIDRDEWAQCLEEYVDYDFGNLFLQVMDTNQDGQVAVEELRSFYQAYGIQIEELDEAFHTLDLNRDGHLSEEEFTKIFAQFLYSDDVQAPGNWIFGTTLPQKL